MLALKNRLKKQKDFEAIFKKGKSWHQDLIFVKIAPNQLEESRFGFIVSARVSKKAVIRNRLKRRLREIVAGQLREGKMKTGWDVMIRALPGLEQKEFAEIKKGLLELFKKAGIVNC